MRATALRVLVALAAVPAVPAVASAHPVKPGATPGFASLGLLSTAEQEGVENTEMAFRGNLAFAGHGSGFRVFDIRDPTAPELLADTPCRAGRHGDLSTFRSKDGRLYLIQSVDRPQTAPDCTSTDTELIAEDERGVSVPRGRFGYEGLRLFDVSEPATPRFVRFVPTACGSHTHTQVPDGGTLHVYVASYPYGREFGITPQVDLERAGDLACIPPHSRISIVDLPLRDPTRGGAVHTEQLSADTALYDPDGPYDPTGGPGGTPIGTAEPWRACHDLQAFMPRRIMIASCTADAQFWSIADAGDPTAGDGEPHTHIRIEPFDQISDAVVTWDGRIAVIRDNTGISRRCEGDASVAGLTHFYPLVQPGAPAPAPLGRYTIPRHQNGEFCGSWYGNVIPATDGRRLMVQAFQQGGTSFYDFTDVRAARELAYSDREDEIGRSDDYAAYWYNGYVYVNGGLNRLDTPGLLDGNRGFEIYALRDEDGGSIRAKRWHSMNPQTQERWQAP